MLTLTLKIVNVTNVENNEVKKASDFAMSTKFSVKLFFPLKLVICNLLTLKLPTVIVKLENVSDYF